MAYTNEMVAHIWAQQEKTSGKSANGNLSFERETLFSYRTPIGRFVNTIDNRRAVLVTSNSYSMTTSCKHMPALARAIDYGRGKYALCFRVPYLSGTGIYGYDAYLPMSNEQHVLNLAHLVAQYETATGQFKRKRDLWYDQDSIEKRLQDLSDTAQDYAVAFGLAVPFLNPCDDAAAIWKYRQEREAKNNTPEMIEKRERERIKRIERKEAKQAEAKRIALLQGMELVEAWKDGADTMLWRMPRTDESNGAFLRIRNDNLETSQGARVPLSHAIRVFQFVKLCRERKQEWKRNGKTLRVGHFQVDCIYADGSFQAGCHFIAWPEIERVARKHDLFEVDAIDTTEQKEMAA